MLRNTQIRTLTISSTLVLRLPPSPEENLVLATFQHECPSAIVDVRRQRPAYLRVSDAAI